MNEALKNYIDDPENPHCNFALALEYAKLEQGAAAITYFLRCAERTDDTDLAYECLLNIAIWFDKQEGRDNTVKCFISHCFTLDPKRPEAYYYFARYFNYRQKYVDAYTLLNTALTFCDFNRKPLKTIEHLYPGKYAILFEKSVAAWWWGKADESRNMLKDLFTNHWHEMNDEHKAAVKNNMKNLGISEEFKPMFYKKAQSTAWIVDDFYEDPDAVRDFALSQDYMQGGIGRGFIGSRTNEQFLFDGLKERFEEIMGKKITKWEDYGMNGRFQFSFAGEPLVYHCDSQKWGAMIYLTPNAPYSCGTTLYAHKKNGARTYYDEGWDEAWKDKEGDPHLDGTHFEPVDVLGNDYNRLVIFDASAIHSASQYFGHYDAKNARLWQMFFFDTED